MFPASTKTGNAVAAFPDVCHTPTPAGPVPVPYPNQAVSQAKSAAKTAPDAKKAGSKASSFVPSAGNQAGTSNVVTSLVQGKTYFVSGGAAVKMEGASVQHVGALAMHNKQVGGSARQHWRNQLQVLHSQIMALPGGNPNRWHELVDNYVIATAQLYIALTE